MDAGAVDVDTGVDFKRNKANFPQILTLGNLVVLGTLSEVIGSFITISSPVAISIFL